MHEDKQGGDRSVHGDNDRNSSTIIRSSYTKPPSPPEVIKEA